LEDEILNNPVPKDSIKVNPGTAHEQPVIAKQKPQVANLDDLIGA